MNFTEIEREILTASKVRLSEIRITMQTQIAKLDYFMSEFMEKYGSCLDEQSGNEKYHAFYRDTTNEYNQVNRLLRVINAYDK